MDFLKNIVNTIQGILFPLQDDTSTREATVAPQNIDPVNFGITARSQNEISIAAQLPDGFIDIQPSAEIRDLINEFINSVPGTADTNEQSNGVVGTASITSMDIPNGNGHTLIKITEDFTGKNIEVVYEPTMSLPSTDTFEAPLSTAKDMSDIFFDSVTSTTAKILPSESEENVSYVDVYIITGLVLLMVIVVSAGIIVWCRKNKLKSEKRNAGDYPIGKQYLNNHALTNTEKIKNVP